MNVPSLDGLPVFMRFSSIFHPECPGSAAGYAPACRLRSIDVLHRTENGVAVAQRKGELKDVRLAYPAVMTPVSSCAMEYGSSQTSSVT